MCDEGTHFLTLQNILCAVALTLGSKVVICIVYESKNKRLSVHLGLGCVSTLAWAVSQHIDTTAIRSGKNTKATFKRFYAQRSYLGTVIEQPW